MFAYSGITEQDALDALTKRVYEERSRQELEGTLATVEMSVLTASNRAFDRRDRCPSSPTPMHGPCGRSASE